MFQPLSSFFQTNGNQFLPHLPSIELEQAAVEEELQRWLDHAEHLTSSSRNLFIGYMRGMTNDILYLLQEMARKGDSAAAIARQAEQSIKYLNDSAQVFLRNKGCYEEKKDKVIYQMENFDIKLNKQKVNFEPFSPPPSKQSESSSHSSDTLFSSSIDWVNGKCAHKLEHDKGKPAALTYEMFTNSLRTPVSENSTNPWRDRIISSAVHIGITETLQMFLPQRLTAYTVMAAAHAVGHVAHTVEPTFNRLAQDKEIAYWWDRQWILSGVEGPCFVSALGQVHLGLKLAQYPSQLLHAVHHTFTALSTKISDTLGLTDVNIAYAARRSLEFLALNSPELLEQKMWEEAVKEKKSKE